MEAPATEAAAPEPVLVPPRPVHTPAGRWPVAPESEERTVGVVVVVGADGRVEAAEPDPGGDPELDRAAVEAAREHLFEPATLDGRPVAARVRVAVRFPAAAPPPSEAPGPAPEVEAPVAPVPPEPEAAAPAPESPEPADPEAADRVTVQGVRRSPPPATASDFRIVVGQLGDVPRDSAEKLLTLAPGFFLTNHSGIGHPSGVFLRGFDAREGQDIEFRLEGVPLNEVSNTHNHGYTDTLFIIPDLVRELHVVEGPFDPRQGDFAVAGTVEFELGLEHRGVILSGSYGSFNTRRLVGLWGPPGTSSGTFVGMEFVDGDGFGPNRAHAAARLIGQYEHRIDSRTRVLVLGTSYTSRFDGAGVIRLDDVEARRMDRCATDADSQFFCLYDPNQGGASSRHGLSARLEHVDTWSAHSHQVFFSARQLRLRENFTGFVTDVRADGGPQRGDGIEQMYDATTAGGRGKYTRWIDGLGHRQEVELGYFVRYDDADALQRRLRRADGVPYAVDFDHRLRVTNIAAYAAGRLRPVERLVLRGGVRLDTFGFSVIDQNRPEADRVGERAGSDAIEAFGVAVQPRGSVQVLTLPGLSVLAGAGVGTRSSDARALSQGEAAPFARVYATEAGLLYERGDRAAPAAFTSRAVAFYTRVSQDLVFDEVAGRNMPLGASNRFGGLVTARLTTAMGLDTQASVTYTEAYLPPAGASFLDLTAGDRLPYIPRWVSRGDLSLRRPLGLLGPGFRYTLAAGASYVAPRPLPFDEFGIPFFEVDAAARLRWQSVELGLQVTNILDRRNRAAEFNYPSNFTSPDAPPSLLPARHFAAAAPRQLMATLRLYIDHPEDGT